MLQKRLQWIQTCSLISCSLLLCSRMSCRSCRALSSSCDTSMRACSKLRFKLWNTHKRFTKQSVQFRSRHMRTANSRCIRWCRWPSLVLRWFFGFLKPWAPRPSAAELTPGRTSYAALLKSPAPSFKTRRKIGIGAHMRDWIIHKTTEELTVNCTFTYDCLHLLEQSESFGSEGLVLCVLVGWKTRSEWTCPF